MVLPFLETSDYLLYKNEIGVQRGTSSDDYGDITEAAVLNFRNISGKRNFYLKMLFKLKKI